MSLCLSVLLQVDTVLSPSGTMICVTPVVCHCCLPCRMNTDNDAPASWLLQLPDPCLEAVLCCCASDPRSLFSAARAHSKLHQAAVLAANSIQADVFEQRHVNSVVQYLTNHGQHVHSAAMHSVGEIVSLSRLPHSKLQGLSSLRLRDMRLQLQPGSGRPGVLGSWPRLKQLQLHHNVLLERGAGAAEGTGAAASAAAPEPGQELV